MKEIIVTTQKEMDELPTSFNEYTVIKIKSSDVIIISEGMGQFHSGGMGQFHSEGIFKNSGQML